MEANMEIQKTNEINRLLDFYYQLLTKKQQDYISLYYQDDYSLGEIAAYFDVSRQAVYDNIRRTEKTLENYESRLHLASDYRKRQAAIKELRDYVKKNYGQDDELKQTIDKLLIMDDKEV